MPGWPYMRPADPAFGGNDRQAVRGFGQRKMLLGHSAKRLRMALWRAMPARELPSYGAGTTEQKVTEGLLKNDGRVLRQVTLP